MIHINEEMRKGVPGSRADSKFPARAGNNIWRGIGAIRTQTTQAAIGSGSQPLLAVTQGGTHEVVVYYDLLRLLIRECWRRVSERKDVSEVDEASRLKEIEAGWLGCPQPDFGDRNPASIIECERFRLPLITSPKEMAIDDDCPLCRAMAKDRTPTFWHLDGAHMEDDFAFSFCCTRDEWEEEERRRKEFDEEFDRRWGGRKREVLDDE
jgi:hypothetical protein